MKNLREQARRDDLLLTKEEQECSTYIRRLMSSNNTNLSNIEIVDKIMNIIVKTKNNKDFIKVFLENMKKK